MDNRIAELEAEIAILRQQLAETDAVIAEFDRRCAERNLYVYADMKVIRALERHASRPVTVKE